MKNIILYLFLLLPIAMSCSKTEDAPCSNANNINDASCNKTNPNIDNRPLSLNINFKDSWFYDQNSQTWNQITKENLSGGLTGLTLPIYSNFLSINKNAALGKISLAQDQFQRKESYPKSDYSPIPYIEIEYEEGVEYLFNYQKRDLNNNIVFETTGNLVISQGRAFLPFINEMFNNQFYSASANIGSRFIHSIRFSAQAQNKIGTISPTIEFETTLQIPSVDFWVDYSEDIKNFNLKNRYKYYFKNNEDYNFNDQLKFFTLRQLTDIPEQIPVDLRIVFQEPPKLRLQQEVFAEFPYDVDAIKANGLATDANVQRGFSFYVQKSEFSSDVDFKMKLRLNNQFVNLDSGRQAEILGLAPGTRWDMEFFYDMNQNPLFNSPDSRPLFNPLKPECAKIQNTLFNPLMEQEDKRLAILNGGFISICHPQTNGKLIIPADQISITPYSQEDTYYSHFNYQPMDLANNRTVGFFSGIRRVTFIAEGCVRVLVRQSGSTNWEIKSRGNAVCDQSGNDGNGWAYFYAEKTATIFDNISDYEIVPGLKSLMQFFGSKPLKQTSDFIFNGDLNNVKHIY